MLFIYLAFLIIGGILLGGSLLLGAMHADADHDAQLETDAHVDADGEAEAEHGADHEGGADAAGIWLPFVSLRFWVFTSCFFGLCGTLLTVIGVGAGVTAVVSIAVGLLCGTAAAWVVHRLSRLESSGDVPTSAEFVGAVGTVLVEVDNDSRGKVRISIRDQQVDLVAETSDEAPLKAGQKVLVVDYKDGIAVVTKSSED